MNTYSKIWYYCNILLLSDYKMNCEETIMKIKNVGGTQQDFISAFSVLLNNNDDPLDNFDKYVQILQMFSFVNTNCLSWASILFNWHFIPYSNEEEFVSNQYVVSSSTFS